MVLNYKLFFSIMIDYRIFNIRPCAIGFSVVLVVKNLPANAGDVRDMGLIPELGRSPGGGHGNPLQRPCLENFIDRAWWATVHGVTQSQTRLKRLSMQHML